MLDNPNYQMIIITKYSYQWYLCNTSNVWTNIHNITTARVSHLRPKLFMPSLLLLPSFLLRCFLFRCRRCSLLQMFLYFPCSAELELKQLNSKLLELSRGGCKATFRVMRGNLTSSDFLRQTGVTEADAVILGEADPSWQPADADALVGSFVQLVRSQLVQPQIGCSASVGKIKFNKLSDQGLTMPCTCLHIAGACL